VAKKTKNTQARKAQQRAAKSNARAKKRREELATITAAHEAASKLQRRHRADSEQRFVSDEYEFWLAHGMNFLCSDYTQGVWDPMYPEVYNVGFKALDRTTIVKRLMDRHLDKKTNRINPVGTRCLAWFSLKPREMFNFVWQIRRNQQHHLTDLPWIEAKKPANPSVWEAIHKAMEVVFAGLESGGQIKDGEFTLPEGGLEAFTGQD
jgi:hypothetical protein